MASIVESLVDTDTEPAFPALARSLRVEEFVIPLLWTLARSWKN